MFDLGFGGQDHRHRLRMDRTHLGIGLRREEAEQLMLANDGVRLGAAGAVPWRPDAGKHCERAAIVEREPSGGLAGFVSAYSQNDVNGTTQRLEGPSQRLQCGDLTFRMFVIGAPPNAGGPGIPQRSIASSRTPSGALRTTGAI
jgi:hypothetical protein